MRYGILTFHNTSNFGAVLQAYSLCHYLNTKGGQSEIIDYRCDFLENREKEFLKSKSKLRALVKKILIEPTLERKKNECRKLLIESNVLSDRTYNAGSIYESNHRYDAFISGSDMIWSQSITGNDTNYFLNFADENKKRFAYASSGVGTWSGNDEKTVKPLLEKYDRISVREIDSAEVITKLTNKECVWVCDPTMLLTTDYWTQFAAEPHIHQEYVLVYFPGETIRNAAIEYAQKHNLKVLVIDWGLKRYAKCKVVSPTSPQQWVGLIKNAKAVFTDSYHGILFSLYFRKQFWTNKTGNRIESLLSYLGLLDRYVSADVELMKNINYVKIEKKMDLFRMKSYRYIEEMLK